MKYLCKRSIKWSSILLLLTLSFTSCLPKVPKYPFQPVEEINQEAQALSDSLEQYIRLWHQGKAPALLPKRLLPKGYDTKRYQRLRLVKYEEITPEQIWVTRPAHEINFDSLYGSFPDPHCTYLVSPVLYAPFGAQLIIEGDFPYCRFFDIQVSPSFYAHEYRYDKWSGKGEVALVDADIIPKEGHENPFLPNGNRKAKNRAYQVVYEMALGNPSTLNESHRPPYRVKGNNRFGSGIQVQGPWGLDKKSGHGRGIWDFGDVWIRYFGIDHGKVPSAGVQLPEMYLQLKTGERFFITADYEGLLKESETTMPNRSIGNNDPASYNNHETGWDKQFGIFLQIATGGAQALYKNKAKDKAYIRQLDLGVNGRGENQPIPASYEPHATGCNYTDYLTTGMSIKKGKVFVLTGKLPTFPETRSGSDTFMPAECRYWSITTYDAAFPFSKIRGLENTSVMDDEIVINEKREYIIVYARAEDRPKNATKENGVTWVDWGKTGTQAITLRWITVSPEWAMPLAPNEENLPWSKATWTGTNYDKKLIGSNQKGFLQDYHPIKHYLTKEEFEALGDALSIENLPAWTE